MLEIGALGTLTTILLVIAISGVVSWGVTQVIRGALVSRKDAIKEKSGKSPWWWSIVLRGGAIVIGGGMGFLLVSTPVGAGLGLMGGVLNTTIITLVKMKIKAVAAKAIDTKK